MLAQFVLAEGALLVVLRKVGEGATGAPLADDLDVLLEVPALHGYGLGFGDQSACCSNALQWLACDEVHEHRVRTSENVHMM